MDDQTPFCWVCGHVEEGHDHYNTVVVHDPHPFSPTHAFTDPKMDSLKRELATLREIARDYLEEVEGWPNGPAQPSKRIPYDEAFHRLEALVRPPSGPESSPEY